MMSPMEYGNYLLELGFTCTFEGTGEDFARYRKGNIEVWYYGDTIRGFTFLDKTRRCPTCGQQENYTVRTEVFFYSTSDFKLFKLNVDLINNEIN